MRHALVAAIVVLAAPAAAQDKKGETPAQVEASVRRKVQAWIRDRAPSKLQCPTCKDESYGRDCEDCGRTRINPHRIDNAFWRYMRPSYRRGRDEDAWTQAVIFGRDGGYSSYARWRDHPAMLESAEISNVVVTRDVAWVTIEAGRHSPSTEAWVKEGGNWYIDVDPASEPGDQLLTHDWFVTGTFSVQAFKKEIARLRAPEIREGITDVERDRAKQERERAEQQLLERIVADVGNITNVGRVERGRADQQLAYEVSFALGGTEVKVVLRPTLDELPAQFETRLAGLRVGTRVYFRGRPASWSKMPYSYRRSAHDTTEVSDLTLDQGEIAE